MIQSSSHNPPDIPAGQFKARCLKLMDEVQTTGISVIITKHGKPVAKLVPIEAGESPTFKNMMGFMRGTLTLHGDITEPTDEWWEADV